MTDILARGLQGRGHEVAVFGYPGGMLEERMRPVAPFEPILKGMDFHPAVVWRAASALRRHRADVVLTLMRKDTTTTALAARALGIPVVVRHANQQRLGRGPYWRFLYGTLPAMHVTNAEATRHTLLDSAKWLRPEQVKVIYNGVDPAPFESAEPLELDLPGNAVVLGYAGSFERRKGVLDLARAWRRVADALPEAHLVLAGKGAMEAEMRAILGDTPRVHWLGYRSDMPRFIRSIDVLVLPSHVEGAPNIVLEGMSGGVAIVATEVSGTPELARDGIEARLVPACDEDRLVEGLIEVFSNGQMREEMGRAGRKRVREKFTLAEMLRAYEEAFLAELALKKDK